MKKIFLLLFSVSCGYGLLAQQAASWLQLTPISVEKPALDQIRNVKNQTFTQEMLLQYSTLNIRNLKPDVRKPNNTYRHLNWSLASMEADTVVMKPVAHGSALTYYAVYLNAPQWVKGELKFQLFGPTEIYLDNVKKITSTESQKTEKSISVELVPGKHSLLVKTIHQGGKQFAASFKAISPAQNSDIEFTTSPLRGKNIYDILDGTKISRVDLSPEGKYVLVTLRESLEGSNVTTTNIYRVDDKKVVYSFPDNVNALQWLPGKDVLSFLRKEGKGYSLYTYEPEQKRLTTCIKEDPAITNYIWSPDLSYILYYQNENYSEKDWQLRKLAGIEDRQTYYRSRSWLCKFDFATGLHSRLTWGNLSTFLMDISRDGQQILFATSYPDYTEYPYRKQNIYLLNIKNNQLDTLWKDRLYSINCQFSPDGTQLLVNGGPSTFGKTGENIDKNPIANQYDTQLYIYTLNNRKVQPITLNFNPSVNEAHWNDNGSIYLLATDADYVHLFRYEPASQQIRRIECPGDVILSISPDQKGHKMMYVASDITYPPVIYALDLQNAEAREWENPAREQYENIVFGEVKDWDYNYKKGTVIDGRYYLPPNFDPAKKYPLIVYYYGGTTPVERSFGGRYPFNLYAANGYVVYVLQPSGTIGYGQEFSARHQNNWGKITADEIISATKAFLKAHNFIDPTKIGCMGASYGGFTTMYLTTQTDLFTCAIAHAGISSIAGYWGDGYWGYSYSTNATAHSFPWNRKDIYVDQSPLFNADKIHTPILLIHGTKDVNVPTAQSIQLYTALKLLGKDAELVFVKDSDHTVVDYELRILWNNTILSYFAKYLKGQPEWWQNIYKDQNL